METGTGRGIYLTGATPRVLMDHSQLLLTSGDAFYEIALQGTDALLSLSNQSKIEITGEDVGSTGISSLEIVRIDRNFQSLEDLGFLLQQLVSQVVMEILKIRPFIYLEKILK